MVYQACHIDGGHHACVCSSNRAANGGLFDSFSLFLLAIPRWCNFDDVLSHAGVAK